MTTVTLTSHTYPSSSPPNNSVAAATAETGSVVDEVPIDHILESAVVLSWKEIMPPQAGLIHVEYTTRADRSLAFLKIWACITRGYLDLVCEYWVDPGPYNTIGLIFSNGYSSRTLVQMLTAIVRNQDLFSASAEATKQIVIQVYPPDAQNILRAELLKARCLSWIQENLKNALPDNAESENEGGKPIAESERPECRHGLF